jgi:hypothetical protein
VLKNDRFLVLENDRFLVLENDRFLVLENDRHPVEWGMAFVFFWVDIHEKLNYIIV